MLNEERRSALAIVEVGEDRAREELLPDRLPEALDLAAGLRMVRPALDVPDAVATKLLFEPGLTTPGGVLAPLVGQDLARCPVVSDAAGQGFQHERAPLVVRHHQAHEVARMVIQERRDVDALMAPEQEREEVRLPELIGLRALEAAISRLRLGFRRRPRLCKALALQQPPYRRIRSPDAKETPHHIADAPASRMGLLALDRKHRLAASIGLR
ncbi:MAG TPA: hypothetical protein VFA72_16485 [Burkholderiales bacterium]|nr:hypothetical protein [Burkholderiales bacterium]